MKCREETEKWTKLKNEQEEQERGMRELQGELKRSKAKSFKEQDAYNKKRQVGEKRKHYTVFYRAPTRLDLTTPHVALRTSPQRISAYQVSPHRTEQGHYIILELLSKNNSYNSYVTAISPVHYQYIYMTVGDDEIAGVLKTVIHVNCLVDFDTGILLKILRD